MKITAEELVAFINKNNNFDAEVTENGEVKIKTKK